MSTRQIKAASQHVSAVRNIVAAFLIVAYVFSGALHEIFALDVTGPSGTHTIVLGESKNRQAPERGIMADDHCHGCFSVSEPAHARPTALVFEPKIAEPLRSTVPLSETVRDLDPPPPKSLT